METIIPTIESMIQERISTDYKIYINYMHMWIINIPEQPSIIISIHPKAHPKVYNVMYSYADFSLNKNNYISTTTSNIDDIPNTLGIILDQKGHPSVQLW
jgi:hypothetical protein